MSRNIDTGSCLGDSQRFFRLHLKKTGLLCLGAILMIAACLFCACGRQKPVSGVVIYTSVDKEYSEPLLRKFEESTGIRVTPVYDASATKPAELVRRLETERGSPAADVFWNGEAVQTMHLKKVGLLSSYNSPSARDIPAAYKDPEGYWTAFGGRARVILVNTNLIPLGKYPDSIFDLLNPVWEPGKIGIASPLSGSSATHAAALYAALGEPKGRAFFEALQKRGVRIVDSSAMVRDLVAKGDLVFGVTDSDEACAATIKKAPVKIVIPDQKSLGALMLPTTVALIRNCPHQDNGIKLIDYLLSKEVEDEILKSGFCQFSLRPGENEASPAVDSNMKKMDVSFDKIYAELPTSNNDMKAIFAK